MGDCTSDQTGVVIRIGRCKDDSDSPESSMIALLHLACSSLVAVACQACRIGYDDGFGNGIDLLAIFHPFTHLTATGCAGLIV